MSLPVKTLVVEHGDQRAFYSDHCNNVFPVSWKKLALFFGLSEPFHLVHQDGTEVVQDHRGLLNVTAGGPRTVVSVCFSSHTDDDLDSHHSRPAVPHPPSSTSLKKPTTDAKHAKVLEYLSHGVIPKNLLGRHMYSARKAFTQNCRRRFKLKNGRLYYNAARRKVKSLPARMRRLQFPEKLVPSEREAKEIVFDDHRSRHEGHERTCERLSKSYIIKDLRNLVRAARAACPTCDAWRPEPKSSAEAILTTRPLELVMFDLSKMPFPCSDTGMEWFLLISDHFTKFVWGSPLPSKNAGPIQAFLREVFMAEGSPERFHSDNGSEFVNELADLVLDELGGVRNSHGRPRNPRCQGLIERANRSVKKKVLQKCMNDGHEDNAVPFPWTRPKYFNLALQEENTAMKKPYNLDPFFCLRLRPFCSPGSTVALDPAQIVELREDMAAAQRRQALKYDIAPVVQYNLGDVVNIKANYKEKKHKRSVATWSAKGTIAGDVTDTTRYYRVRYITKGLRNEKPGELAKNMLHCSLLRLCPDPPSASQASQATFSTHEDDPVRSNHSTYDSNHSTYDGSGQAALADAEATGRFSAAVAQEPLQPSQTQASRQSDWVPATPETYTPCSVINDDSGGHDHVVAGPGSGPAEDSGDGHPWNDEFSPAAESLRRTTQLSEALRARHAATSPKKKKRAAKAEVTPTRKKPKPSGRTYNPVFLLTLHLTASSNQLPVHGSGRVSRRDMDLALVGTTVVVPAIWYGTEWAKLAHPGCHSRWFYKLTIKDVTDAGTSSVKFTAMELQDEALYPMSRNAVKMYNELWKRQGCWESETYTTNLHGTVFNDSDDDKIELSQYKPMHSTTTRDGNESSSADEVREVAAPAPVTLRSLELTASWIAQHRTAWSNHRLSCHVDTFLFLELAALTHHPIGLRNRYPLTR